MGGRGIVLIALALVAIWLLTGFYIVSPAQVGINTRFGAYTGKTGDGKIWITEVARVQRIRTGESGEDAL